MGTQRQTVAVRLLHALKVRDAQDDDELAQRIGADRQHVNQVARALETRGVLKRSVGPDGKLVNVLRPESEVGALDDAAKPKTASVAVLIAEDTVKRGLYAHLRAQGYRGQVAWGHAPGVDIDVRGPSGRLLIEAKGGAASSPQQVNYFLGALGELIQRMSDDSARYGLALPDNPQYRRLAQRLPTLVWDRLRLVVYFVNGDGRVDAMEGPGGEET